MLEGHRETRGLAEQQGKANAAVLLIVGHVPAQGDPICMRAVWLIV